MFIHIGGDKVVLTKDVIMILDKSALDAKDTSDFIQVAQEEGFISEDDILLNKNCNDKKSAVILDKKILYSPISSVTLAKRANFIKNLK
ncbi:DUF370 domain-containing protein [Tepidanaerobacter sp. GT38]|uniref:extracellular matrix regulator RemB n=1 Tax=Tepidanaerobacter sp. GT38 TaxID=2722793 RepID=UPI001F27A0C7|nr:extracellular matrix/biofilm biosynthesis regulator RemA family protein [Tepidanaerobacter sp. GT38]MCG1011828.1 DUF370 domain-containing protein [Tepidanaerobacter sp. GT38]